AAAGRSPARARRSLRRVSGARDPDRAPQRGVALHVPRPRSHAARAGGGTGARAGAAGAGGRAWGTTESGLIRRSWTRWRRSFAASRGTGGGGGGAGGRAAGGSGGAAARGGAQ